MLFTGIDWSDQTLDFYLQDEQDNPLVQGQVKISMDGLIDMFGQLEKHGRPEEISIATETPHGSWIQAILDRGYQVYPVNPGSINKFREALYNQGDKTDKIDRRVIAKFLNTFHKSLKPLKPDSNEIIVLRVATQNRLRLVEEQTAKTNELKCLLKCHYPAFLELFSGLKSNIALDFLQDFPTQDKMTGLTPKQLEKWLKKHSYPSMIRFEKMVEILKTPALPIAKHLQEANVSLICYLARSLQALITEIKACDKAINDHLDGLPEADWIRSLPGAGDVLAPALLACLGRDPKRFESTSKAQAFFGTAPVTEQSGKYHRVYFRYGCWKYARRTFHLFAAQTLKYCSWARAFYEKQRNRGKTHHTALRSLAHKWVKILLAMKRSGSCYDNNMFVNSQRRYLLKQEQLNAVNY